jgi:hypothetical protein
MTERINQIETNLKHGLDKEIRTRLHLQRLLYLTSSHWNSSFVLLWTSHRNSWCLRQHWWKFKYLDSLIFQDMTFSLMIQPYIEKIDLKDECSQQIEWDHFSCSFGEICIISCEILCHDIFDLSMKIKNTC